MNTLRTLFSICFFLLIFSISAKPLLEISIPVNQVHLNPSGSSTLTFSVKNVSGKTLTGIEIPKTQFITSIFSAQFENTTCPDSLSNNHSCQMTFKVSGSKDGVATLSPEICISGGYVCSHGSIQVTVNEVKQKQPVTSLAATLPDNVQVGVAYPIVASFLNTDTLYPITGLHISQTLANSVETANSCSSGVLAPLGSCQVSYLFTPPLDGSYHLTGTFHYNEGQPVTLSKTVLATKGAISGTVVTPLPANIEIDRHYEIVFQYTNFGTADVTYTAIPNPPELSAVVNTCIGGTLVSHHSCLISGEYKAVTIGTKTISTTFTATGPGTINPVPLTTSSVATDVAIMGNVLPALPSSLTPGVSYPVVFTFTNTNPTLAAKDVELDKLLPNFTEITNTCGTLLAPGASCAVGGDFQTTSEGPVALTVLFDHDGNVSVPLTTSSIATAASIVGTVEGFPANVEKNTKHKVTFTFANHGSADATITGTTLVFPNSVGPQINTCTGTLSPNAHCTISDYLQNAPLGATSWSATLSYTGGAGASIINVPVNTNTTVTDTVVTGTLTTSIPANVSTNMSRNFVFSFANNGSSVLPATDIKLVKSLPHTSNVSDNCGTTLPLGNSCTIQGTFNSNSSGPQTLSVTLLYKEGGPVTLNNTTMVTGVLSQAANISASTSYASPNMNQYSLDGTRRAGFVVLPELQSTTVTGAPTTLIWAAGGTTSFSVLLQRTQDGQNYTVNFSGCRSIPCGTYTMNSAVGCYSSAGQFVLGSGDNSSLPSGTYTGHLLVSMQDWVSTYRQLLDLNITYTK